MAEGLRFQQIDGANDPLRVVEVADFLDLHIFPREELRNPDYSRAAILHQDSRCFYVAEGDTLVTAGSFRRKPSLPQEAVLDLFAVAPEYRKQGYGAQLLEHLETVAFELGCRTMQLSAFDEEAGAYFRRRAYIYVPQRHRTGYGILMHKRLERTS